MSSVSVTVSIHQVRIHAAEDTSRTTTHENKSHLGCTNLSKQYSLTRVTCQTLWALGR